MSTIFNSSKTAETINRAIDNNMGTTTTGQGASSAGLIISEDLQPIVQCVQGFDYSISEKTVTGVPPLTFHAIAQHLFDWSIDGNTDGGNSVGEMTNNLFNITTATLGKYIDASGQEATSTAQTETSKLNHTDYIDVVEDESYIYSYVNGLGTVNTIALCWFNEQKEIISRDTLNVYVSNVSYTLSAVAPSSAKYCIINFTGYPVEISCLRFNRGSTTLPYEPYGYDVPIVVNNTDTYHCYISDVLRKSGGETPVYDTMSSDGTIIRRVDTDGTPLEEPITETYTAPDIIVNWGWNTVDVDTTVTPSSMTINYKDD